MNQAQIRTMETSAGFFRDEITRHQSVLDSLGGSPLIKAGVQTGAEVGSPTQGSPVTGSSFAVLIPQDLKHMVYSTIASKKERCPLLNDLKRTPSQQVIIERDVLKRHGDYNMVSSVSEAGVPGVTTSTYDKITNVIAYHSVTRLITHVATNVTILNTSYPQVGVGGKGGLAMEQEQGSLELGEKIEIKYWNSRESDSQYDRDGVLWQIKNEGTENINWIDKRGTELTFDDIVSALANVIRDTYEGKPEKLYLPAEIWKGLSQEAATKNRLDPARASSGNEGKPGEIVWNKATRQLFLIGPTGQILELVETRLIHVEPEIPSTNKGEYDTLAVPTITTPASASTSYFGATDAGTYTYKYIGRFLKGYTAAVTTAGIAVLEDDVVRWTTVDGAVGSDTNPFLGYRIWRSEKDGTSTYKLLGDFGKNTDGGANTSLFDDTNFIVPGMYACAALQHSEGAIEEDVLLDSFQFPLAQVERSYPFTIGRYSQVEVVMPRKQIVWWNCAPAA